MSCASLPNECLEAIFLAATQAGDAAPLLLKTCSLVSQRWRHVAQKMLFRHIQVNGQYALDGVCALLDKRWACLKIHRLRISGCFCLDGLFSIRACVKHLEVAFRSGSMAPLLPTQQNKVRVLSLAVSGLPPQRVSSLVKALQGLKRLEITRPCISLHPLGGVDLFQHPGVDTLCLYDLDPLQPLASLVLNLGSVCHLELRNLHSSTVNDITALAAQSSLASIVIENCQLPDVRDKPEQTPAFDNFTSITIFGLPSLPWLDVFDKSRPSYFTLFLRVLPAPIDDPSLRFPSRRGAPTVPSAHPVLACQQLRDVLMSMNTDRCRYACLSKIKNIRIVHSSTMPNPAYHSPILDRPLCNPGTQNIDELPVSPIEKQYIDWLLLEGWRLPSSVTDKIVTTRVDISSTQELSDWAYKERLHLYLSNHKI